MKIYKFAGSIVIVLCCISPMHAQINYDEEKVPEYTLPDPLITTNGKRINTAEEWMSVRREEILRLFETHVYGKVPEGNLKIEYDLINTDVRAINGTAIRKDVVISFMKGKDTLKADLLIYLPSGTNEPVPIFLGLNFYGNHTIHPDPGIQITSSYVGNNEDLHISNHTATEESRGVRSERWPVEKILNRGYGLATMYYGDIDPDYDDGFQNGIHALLDYSDPGMRSSISGWAFGLSAAMDYFVMDEDIRENQVAVIGHSRLGKTSLWAGVNDPRFAMVISNDSGCGGAALSRRRFGETVERINSSFPHWFCRKFHEFGGNEAALPVDQHMLISLIAPRPVYVASAEDDKWADPMGEFLSLYHAGPVYQLFGYDVFEEDIMPEINKPLWRGKMGYHIRTGSHDITEYDWEQYLDFADLHFER